MLSFSSKNDIFFSGWTGVLKKTNLCDVKPTYLYIWLDPCYMYYIECIKLFDIKNLPCTATGLQCLFLSKISHFQNSDIGRFDSMRISRSCKT